MIRPSVARLAAMPDADRIRVALLALGGEPYAPDPRHRIESRLRAREAS